MRCPLANSRHENLLFGECLFRGSTPGPSFARTESPRFTFAPYGSADFPCDFSFLFARDRNFADRKMSITISQDRPPKWVIAESEIGIHT